MSARAIGVTGNIGSGKSTVGRMLEGLGCARIDADLVAREVMAPDLPAWKAVVERFGPDILLPDRTFDRARLGALAFADPAALLDLDQAVHPWVRREVRDRLAVLGHEQVAVVEAVKLLEAGMDEDVDAVWVVVAPDAIAVSRLVESRHMARDEATRRLTAQPPVGPKLGRADAVIHNGGTAQETETQVAAAYRRLQERWASEPSCPAGTNCATVSGKALRGAPRRRS